MIVSICIKVAFILAGLLAIGLSVSTLVKRSATPLFTVIWVIFGVVLVLTGIFLEPYNWANVLGLPTIAMIGVLGLSAILFFWYLTKKIDEMQNKMQETVIQLTLLNDENAQMKREIKALQAGLKDGLNNVAKLSAEADAVATAAAAELLPDENTSGKSILFVNNTLSTGGAEKVLLTLMERYVKQGNTVHLFVVTGMGELVSQLPEGVKLLNTDFDDESVLSAEGKQKLVSKVAKAEKQGFTGVRLLPYQARAFANMVRAGKIRFEKLAWRALAETAPAITNEYDLAVAFTEGAATYYVADRVAAAQKVAFVHTPYIHAGYTKQLDRDCYNYIDEIYAVADSVKESFLVVHPECYNKVNVYENPLDYEKIDALAQERVEWSSSNRILSVARLVALKSYDRMIAAAKILKDKGYVFNWVALGEGEDHQKIQALIDAEGLSEYFTLKGNVLNPYPYMAQCEVYVHATSYEGKSVAVREAKALACAIVLSDAPGNEGVIEDGVSGLYTSLEPEDIATRIARLLDDKKTAARYGLAARKSEHGK